MNTNIVSVTKGLKHEKQSQSKMETNSTQNRVLMYSGEKR